MQLGGLAGSSIGFMIGRSWVQLSPTVVPSMALYSVVHVSKLVISVGIRTLCE